MPVLLLETTVKGFLSDVEIRLEGFKIQMAYDGNETRKSTDLIEVKDTYLNVFFHGVGPVAGTGWELSINQLDPPVGKNPNANKNPIYEIKGKTQANGHSIVFGGVTL